MSNKDKPDPIIPPTKDVSPDDALRAFMQVDGQKVKEKEKEQRKERRPDPSDAD